MNVFRLKRLPVLGHFLLIASDAVLWYFGSVLGAVYGVAFLGMAATWAAGILAIEAPVASRLYQQRKERKAERETAYAECLTFADRYARTWHESTALDAAYNVARSDSKAAKNRFDLDQSYENQCAATSAETKTVMASKSLLSAKSISDNLRKEYLAARARVDQLAPRPVRSALADFNQCLTQETSARDSARSSFIKAVQADLGQPHWPDKRSLP
jgi:hypothetical protein